MHIGEKVKARAKDLRMGATELGRLLHTSPQNVYGIYLRKSINSDLLFELCKALQFDFFSYYPLHSNLTVEEPIADYSRKQKENKNIEEELKKLQDKHDALIALYEGTTKKRVPKLLR